MYYDITCVRFAQRTEQNCSPAVTREYETGLLFEYNYKRRLIRSPYRVTTVGRRFYLSDPYGNEIDFGAEETSFTYNEILELIDQCSCCTPFMFVHSDEIENNGDGTYSIPKILAPDEGDVVFDESLNLYEYKNGTWVVHPQTANNYDGVYNIDSTDVTDNGDGTYTITGIVSPDLGEMAITEDLTFYEFDGFAWVLKFAGLGDFISSATNNGDDTYTFTSFDGNTNFTITIPILSIAEGPGMEIDLTDPKRPKVGLNQAAQDSLDLADSAVQPGDLADVATSGDYDDLQNKPPIPNSLEDLSGTSDDITEGSTQLFFTLIERNKLSGIAPGAEVNVNADWNAVSGDAEILNKPTLGTAAAADTGDFATAAQGSKADTAVQPGDLSTVATSGEFGDLQNIPDFIEESQRDQPGGFAGVGMDGFIPSLLLPSYVDDVLEFADFSSLPATGESGKIYVTLDDNLTYRWSGSAYVEISPSLALGETSSTAYRGDRGKTAYDHSQVTSGNPHNVTASEVGLGNVDNTSDADKPVSTAQQAAINQAETNANQYTDDEIANLPCSVQTYPTFGDLPADGKECVLYIADGKYWQWGESYCDYQNPVNPFEPFFNSFEELPNPGDPSFTYVVDLGGGNLELYVWVDGAYQPVYFDGGLYPPEWTEGQYAYVAVPGGGAVIVRACKQYVDVTPDQEIVNLFTDDLTLSELRQHEIRPGSAFVMNSVRQGSPGYGKFSIGDSYVQLLTTDNGAPAIVQVAGVTVASGGSYVELNNYRGSERSGQLRIQQGSTRLNVSMPDGDMHIHLIPTGMFIKPLQNINVGSLVGRAFLKLIDGQGKVEYQIITADDIDDTSSVQKFVTQAEKDAIGKPVPIPEYASDTDADNDSNLAANAPYSVTGDRVVKTKSSASPFNPSYGYQTLTDAATIVWDMDLGEMAEVTLGGNRTLSNPTNLKRGTYTLLVKQDGTGGRELSFDSAFKWSAGIPPTLTSTANGVDLLTFVSDGTNLYGAITQNYS